MSPDGFIITNNHVIEDATKIEVTTNDNIRYEAKLVGTDPYTDIAVLKIQNQKPLPTFILLIQIVQELVNGF